MTDLPRDFLCVRGVVFLGVRLAVVQDNDGGHKVHQLARVGQNHQVLFDVTPTEPVSCDVKKYNVTYAPTGV